MGLLSRIKNALSAFVTNGENNRIVQNELMRREMSTEIYTSNPSRPYTGHINGKSVLVSRCNRIALDCASVVFKHIEEQDGKYVKTIDSDLNECLSLNPNQDQCAIKFFQDVVLTMFEQGCVAIIPTKYTFLNSENGSELDDTTFNNANDTDILNVESLRRGTIIKWFAHYVEVEVFNEDTNQSNTLMLPKKWIAIIENPLYAIMNEPNSTLRSLVRALSLMDMSNEVAGSNKLDLIIQVPYVMKSDYVKSQAKERLKDIENQLNSSKYGIAYTDGVEKIQQLNRPIENNIPKTVEMLSRMLDSQLCIDEKVMNGTADEKTMQNYYARTVFPICNVIRDEMKRKFLSKEARNKGESIQYYINPFALAGPTSMAEISDKFTRNAILSSNEVRQAMGLIPRSEPIADELSNKNMPKEDEESPKKDDKPKEETT